MQLAIGQAPDRPGVAGGIAQIDPTRPMVAVRQSGQRFEPVAERIALASGGECSSGASSRDGRPSQSNSLGVFAWLKIDLRQIIEQSLRLTQMRRAASHGRQRLWPPRGHCREHLMTQVIARELPILIEGSSIQLSLMCRCIGLQLSARNIEQRPQ